MHKKRYVILTLVLLLLAGCANEPPEKEREPVLEEAAAVVPGPTPQTAGVTILADGIVQAAQPPLPVAFEISGKLLDLEVQPGDQVQAGVVLARLATEDSLDSYQAVVTSAELSVLRAQQALDALFANAGMMTSQAQMNLAVAQDELENAEYRWRVQQGGNRASGDTIAAAEANLVLAEQQVKVAQAEFNRFSGRPDDDPLRALALSNLVASKQHRDSVLRGLNWYTGSPTDSDQALLDAEVAVAAARLAEARQEWEKRQSGPAADELAVAEAELANAQAQLAQAQRDLDKVIEGGVLSAPIDGVVLTVEAASGMLVGGGTPIVTLLNERQLEFVTINLSERDLGQISPGQTALVTLKAFPGQPIEARILRIGWEAGAGVGDAATFPVMLDLSGADLVIRPGMTGRVEIQP